MVSRKVFNINVSKRMDYKPISLVEKIRIFLVVSKELINLANRFDGDSTIELQIIGKGNA